MTKTEHALGLHIAVGDNAYDSRHEERNDTLDSVEPSDLFFKADGIKKIAEGDKLGAPELELQKVHQRKAEFYGADFNHVCLVFC